MKADIAKAEEMAGRKMIAPIGSCFDQSIKYFINRKFTVKERGRLCHAIAIANMPGQEGTTIAHAWVEYTNKTGLRLGADLLWGVATFASKMREDLKVSYIVEYTQKQAFALWLKSPPPWDDKILEVIQHLRANAH